MPPPLAPARRQAEHGENLRRELRRVVTPGTLHEDELHDSRRENFLAAVVCERQEAGRAGAGAEEATWRWGLAYTDLTTGVFRATVRLRGASPRGDPLFLFLVACCTPDGPCAMAPSCPLLRTPRYSSGLGC